MDIHKAEYVKSAVFPKDYVENIYPEFAFIGKSNVGKSSLINSLTNRRTLAKTSRTPGRTQLVNFFIANDKFLVIDLPGYGFAKMPKNEKEKIAGVVEDYLMSKRCQRVLWLLDIRRTPTSDEIKLAEWFKDQGIKYKVIFTKVDKLSNNERLQQMKEIKKHIDYDRKEIIAYSSLTREGRDKLLAYIEAELVDIAAEMEERNNPVIDELEVESVEEVQTEE